MSFQEGYKITLCLCIFVVFICSSSMFTVTYLIAYGDCPVPVTADN